MVVVPQPSAQDRTAAHDMFAVDVASKSLGIELLEAGGGSARARMRVSEAMVNGHDIAHGGFIFLLADTAFACACNSYGPVTVAAGADITFVASAQLGDELVATATERTRYGRSGIYDVTVHRVDAGKTAAPAAPAVPTGPVVPAAPTVIAEFRGRSRAIQRDREES